MRLNAAPDPTRMPTSRCRSHSLHRRQAGRDARAHAEHLLKDAAVKTQVGACRQ